MVQWLIKSFAGIFYEYMYIVILSDFSKAAKYSMNTINISQISWISTFHSIFQVPKLFLTKNRLASYLLILFYEDHQFYRPLSVHSKSSTKMTEQFLFFQADFSLFYYTFFNIYVEWLAPKKHSYTSCGKRNRAI